MAFLDIQDIELNFSGICALDGVSLEAEQGQLVAVIGPNGAGKTSLFNCISGIYRPQKGQINFAGENLLGQAPHRIAALGVARTFQNLALFDHLTVLENLLLGRHHIYKTSWWQDLFWLEAAKKAEIVHREKVEEILEFLDLERYRKMPVGILPYGVLKRIELGRALCMEPKLLLLDEPAAGLNQEATEDMARYLLDVKEELHITQVLIEHELRFVMDLADHMTVLEFGRMVTSGLPAEVAAHPEVIRAYTGKGDADVAASA